MKQKTTPDGHLYNLAANRVYFTFGANFEQIYSQPHFWKIGRLEDWKYPVFQSPNLPGCAELAPILKYCPANLTVWQDSRTNDIISGGFPIKE